MVEHTPGPWVANSISMENGDIGVGAPDLRIVIAHVHNAASFGDMIAGALKRGGGRVRENDCHTQFANARLIAAAPDLLKQLELMVELFDGHQGMELRWAKDAIAKAKGAA